MSQEPAAAASSAAERSPSATSTAATPRRVEKSLDKTGVCRFRRATIPRRAGVAVRAMRSSRTRRASSARRAEKTRTATTPHAKAMSSTTEPRVRSECVNTQVALNGGDERGSKETCSERPSTPRGNQPHRPRVLYHAVAYLAVS